MARHPNPLVAMSARHPMKSPVGNQARLTSAPPLRRGTFFFQTLNCKEQRVEPTQKATSARPDSLEMISNAPSDLASITP
jgi:hypothetical protein